MPALKPTTSPGSTHDPLIRILAEMVDSALRWEAEHNKLTEEPTVINLKPTDADPKSPS